MDIRLCREVFSCSESPWRKKMTIRHWNGISTKVPDDNWAAIVRFKVPNDVGVGRHIKLCLWRLLVNYYGLKDILNFVYGSSNLINYIRVS